MNMSRLKSQESLSKIQREAIPCLSSLESSIRTSSIKPVKESLLAFFNSLENLELIIKSLEVDLDINIDEEIDTFISESSGDNFSILNFLRIMPKSFSEQEKTELSIHLHEVSLSLSDLVHLNFCAIPDNLWDNVIFEILQDLHSTVTYNGKSAVELINRSEFA